MHGMARSDSFHGMMTLRLVEYAVALNQHRSFARAAQAMRVTQPTFSRAIAALERNLGARLFVRSSRRVEPTPEGALFLVHAERLLAGAAQLRTALGDYKHLRSGRVVVGVGPYPLDISVIECVARLATRHPQLQIELVEGRWREFGPKLLSGEVEIAVVDTSILSADPRFEVEGLPPHDGCFYCRPGHPLAGRSGVRVAEILEHPMVGPRLPARAFASAARPRSRLARDPMTGDFVPHIVTTSIAAARAIVRRTDGIGIAAPIELEEEVRRGTLVLLDAAAGTLRTAYGIGWLRSTVLSPGARTFVETLKEVEAEIAGSPRSRSPSKRGQRLRREGRRPGRLEER